MGRVMRVLLDRVIIEAEPTTAPAPLKPGDGVVFDAANWRSPEEREEGGHVYQAVPLRGNQIELRFGNGTVDFERIRVGDLVWRTHDPELDKVARPWTQATTPVHKQPVQVRVTAHEGEPLLIEWSLTEQPLNVVVRSETSLTHAQNRAVSREFVQEQLGRLGNTPYSLATLDLNLHGQPFVPSSLLNQLRRSAVEQLAAAQGQPYTTTIHQPETTLSTLLEQITPHSVADSVPQLHLLVRTPEQLEAAIACKPASITLDYLELYGLKPAVERVQAHGITARVASPRILKPSEQRIVHFLLKLNCEIVVRSGGLLQALRTADHPPLIGDFSLNAANALSADTFLRLGLTRLSPTHDLNAAQITTLAQQVGADKLEVIAYHHLPVFHTEHCVFSRFLSDGTSYKNCGHPCEQHQVALQDINGRAHAVMADVGCRNTVFGAEAQEASRHLPAWREAGIRHLRLEFVHETAAQVTQIATAFSRALTGGMSPQEMNRQLKQIAPQGTTEGSLFVRDNYLMIPLTQ